MKQKKKKRKKEINERLIKDRINRHIRTLFDQKEEDYYKPKRVVNNLWNKNYIEYESNGDKNRNLLLDEYLNKIKLYLKNIIINLQNSDAWNMQLTIEINFISSKDAEEEHAIHSKSNNIKFTSYNDANEVVDKLFESLLSRYQGNLETSMRRSDFLFEVNCKREGLYIDSPDWIKKKKATINPKNTDDKCFQYAVTVALNYGEIN